MRSIKMFGKDAQKKSKPQKIFLHGTTFFIVLIEIQNNNLPHGQKNQSCDKKEEKS